MMETFCRLLRRIVQVDLYPPAEWIVIGYLKDGEQQFVTIHPDIHEDIRRLLVQDALAGHSLK